MNKTLCTKKELDVTKENVAQKNVPNRNPEQKIWINRLLLLAGIEINFGSEYNSAFRARSSFPKKISLTKQKKLWSKKCVAFILYKQLNVGWNEKREVISKSKL